MQSFLIRFKRLSLFFFFLLFVLDVYSVFSLCPLSRVGLESFITVIAVEMLLSMRNGTTAQHFHTTDCVYSRDQLIAPDIWRYPFKYGEKHL